MIYAEHNGYTNYPTWDVAMRISNTESIYHFFQNTAKEITKKFPDENERRRQLATAIENFMDMTCTKHPGPVWEDLISWVKHQVNFDEIAVSILEGLE